MDTPDLLSHNGEIVREGTILWDIFESKFYVITLIDDETLKYSLAPQDSNDVRNYLSLHKDAIIDRYNIVQIATYWNP